MTQKTQVLGPLVLALLGWQSAAHAGLGAERRSIEMDREAMHGQLQSTSTAQYELHTITTAEGTVMHEYATVQGKVFAVTWSGPMPPNLQQLFGSYYDQFQSAAATSKGVGIGAHRQMSVRQADFVLRAVGRMRDYHGRAYVPSLVPPGVSAENLP